MDDVRVFGSVARGSSRPDSDVDLLVMLRPGYGVLDVSELILDLEEYLGCHVDVVVNRGESPALTHIRDESVPL